MTARAMQFLLILLSTVFVVMPAGAADVNREWVDFTPPAEIK